MNTIKADYIHDLFNRIDPDVFYEHYWPGEIVWDEFSDFCFIVEQVGLDEVERTITEADAWLVD